MKVIDSLLSFRNKKYILNTDLHAIVDLDAPPSLHFPLNNADGVACASLVDRGDTLEYGQPVWSVDEKHVFPSPVAGEVVDIVNVPDTRGERMVPSITVKPSASKSDNKFPPLKLTASVEDLKKRLDETGIQTDRFDTKPLTELLCPPDEKKVQAIIILAMDREPLTASYFQQFKERPDDVFSAAEILKKVAAAGKVFVALPESERANNVIPKTGKDVEILWVKPQYPASLDPFLIEQTGVGEDVVVISSETALAALDAVTKGQIQYQKVLTVVSPDKKIIGNFRVWIGTTFKDIFDHVGLKPGEKDKIVAGGPMQGYAQYSVDGTVDSGVNALMLIKSEDVIPWSTEPCINCGKCVEACPVNLQIQLIGRYSEFSLFDRTRDYEIEACIECGMCAAVCTARRPLVQFIDLAKKQLVKLDSGEKEVEEPGIPATVKGRRKITVATNDPAMATFSGLPRFVVGYSPHWRSKASITKLNIAFILFLLPAVFVSAFAQFYSPSVMEVGASFTSISEGMRSMLQIMGLNSGFLWFSGVLGTVFFGMGAGILVEYVCQVLMRQPYYATNGHGALMGLIIALLMPPSVPVWVMLVAVVVAIFMAKQVFGGIGGYPIHPALVGWLVVYLSWPQYVYPIGTASIAGFNSAVIVLTVLGGIGLILTGYIRFEISLSVIVGTLIFAVLFQGSLNGSIADQFMTGHVFLAAFFLATDATSSPVNRLAMLIYGLGIGFLIILIRALGVWPDAVPFAIMMMNILSPLLDRIKPKVIKMAV